MLDSRPPLLELQDITKSFGGVTALRGVDFTLRPGEIHGLVGENGAGKSTLMKIIAGVHTGFSGRFLLDGREVHFHSARDARAAGIAMVHQELSVAPDLTVAENVFLGNQPTNALGIVQWRRMAREAAEQLKRLGIDADPMSRLGDLPIGVQQLIEIARVLFSGARIIILDEPTSALSPPEVERLFAALRRLRAQGTGIIFISHFIEDILLISDEVTVFRNGRKIMETRAADTSKAALIEAMIGKGRDALEDSYTHDISLPAPAADKPVVVEADGLSLARNLKRVSFSVHAGEVLGVYGFMGCGQLELARILFGKLAPDAGELRISGERNRFKSTADARRAGIAFVPESRRDMLFLQEPVYKNVSISILDRIDALLLKPARERALAQRQVEQLQIRPADVEIELGLLSGGNQQKVALAKWLSHPPRLLVLCEPTRGMDVGAKSDVIQIVRQLRDQGIAVIVLSTEPETVLSLADRVIVLKRGEVVREFAGETISKDRLLEAA
ncbi:Putative ABC transporter (ATP-binding protein); putative ribose transport system [Bradyrhizobium sp. ORS 278]|uniref:sugar ABC transporter ATP-binding protein n=1 Tax=Bradyrhizobium sp. (strain ORS 278) TaxID=114615 RepID=UPI0001508985|nr:sugar ABC transporter ATP-binding protein [Bradyrhizobium sp. ORS 278]CAL77916.1 Putative ABC transporter (ATP-binding protein); putative ribose transport system [Bradyrhizobium sp. ORS 278]